VQSGKMVMMITPLMRDYKRGEEGQRGGWLEKIVRDIEKKKRNHTRETKGDKGKQRG